MEMIGSRVMGLWSNGSWYPGRVTQQRDRRGTPQYFVQFDDGDTAWLTQEQIRVKSPPPSAAGGVGPAPGARVEGEWAEESWYPGYVAEASADGATFFVQFDDGDTSWLPPARIRRLADLPDAAPTPQLTVGTRVKGEWAEDSWYPGAVARLNANATMFFIQFDDGDQKWLPAAQIRFTPQARPAHAAPASFQTPTAAPALETRCAYCKARIPRSDLTRCAECGAPL